MKTKLISFAKLYTHERAMDIHSNPINSSIKKSRFWKKNVKSYPKQNDLYWSRNLWKSVQIIKKWHLCSIFNQNNTPFSGSMMKIIVLKFCFYFCVQYALTIPFYDFELSFLKLILKRTLYGFYMERYTYHF